MKRTACLLLGGCLLGWLLLAGEAHAQSLWQMVKQGTSTVKLAASASFAVDRYKELCQAVDAAWAAQKTLGVTGVDSCDAATARSVVIANDLLKFSGSKTFQANGMILLQLIADNSLAGANLKKALDLRRDLFNTVYQDAKPATIQQTGWLVGQEANIVSAAHDAADLDLTPPQIRLAGRVAKIRESWINPYRAMQDFEDQFTQPHTVGGADKGASPAGGKPTTPVKGGGGSTQPQGGSGRTADCFAQKFGGGGGPAPSDPSPITANAFAQEATNGAAGIPGGVSGKGLQEVPCYLNPGSSGYGLRYQPGLVRKAPYGDSGSNWIPKGKGEIENMGEKYKQKGESVAYGTVTRNGDQKGEIVIVNVEVWQMNSGGYIISTNTTESAMGEQQPTEQSKLAGAKPPKNGDTVDVYTTSTNEPVKVELKTTEEEKKAEGSNKKAEEKKKEQEKGTGGKSFLNPEADAATCNDAVSALVGCLSTEQEACGGGGEIITGDKVGETVDGSTSKAGDGCDNSSLCEKKLAPVAGGLGMPAPDGGGLAGLCKKKEKGGIPVIAQEWIIDWGPEGKPGGGPKGKPCDASVVCTEIMCPEGTQCVATPLPPNGMCSAVCKPKGKTPGQGP